MKKVSYFFLLLFFLFFARECQAVVKKNVSVKSMNDLIIQDGGRKKPFDTYARENLVKLTGRSKWYDSEHHKWTALEVMSDFALGTNNWLNEEIIKVSYIPLKERLGLSVDKKFFSHRQIRSNSDVSRKLTELLSINETQPNYDKKLAAEGKTLSRQLRQLEFLMTPEAFCWVPVEGQGRWITVDECAEIYGEKGKNLENIYANLRDAYQTENNDLFLNCVGKFHLELQQLLVGQHPTSKNRLELSKIKLELLYTHLHPFRVAWILFLLSFILLLLSRKEGKKFGIYGMAMGLFVVAILFQVAGFTLRSLISGRAPVTNMYEVLVFMAFGASFIALIYELIYHQKVFALASSIVAAITLILADNLPAVFDPTIQPLVPVLQSNWWLTVHVITITIGYAAFLQALGIGHVAMARYLFYPNDLQSIDRLTKFNYRTMQIGVLFLAAGTLLGGLWAEKAWGRFWGWDPKETWALIALLLYLGVLHARYTKWIGSFGLNAASVLAFQGIIMAGYGVNYLLGTGKHSYGFGVGGEAFVGAFVLIELILVALAVFRYKKK